MPLESRLRILLFISFHIIHFSSLCQIFTVPLFSLPLALLSLLLLLLLLLLLRLLLLFFLLPLTLPLTFLQFFFSIPSSLFNFRCAVLRFTRLHDAEILGRLQQICSMENVDYDLSGLESIIFTAEGDMRNALNALQVSDRYSIFNKFK